MPDEDRDFEGRTGSDHDLAHEIHELHEAIEGYNQELEFFRKACYAIIGLVAAGLGMDASILM
ncbi:uncharacterized protein METZ01_LOCUS333352 [marine metagenome]|uniref:Uncharacterized protein n=1 Tax=marine metagenome TaxID=408172 RepID=A0A382Q6D7_9ZZZZ